jgi:hypothetical protein
MARRVEFDLPFAPAPGGRDHARVLQDHLTWLGTYGLIPVGTSLPRYIATGPHVAASQFHPDATGDELRLTTDYYGWMILSDGRLDDLLAEGTDATSEFVAQLAAVIDNRPADSAEPLVLALRDLWSRWADGMSTAWADRAAKHWREFLTSQITEAANREQPTALTVEEYLDLRARTGQMRIILDLAERLSHAELPRRAMNSELVQALYGLTVDVVDAVQDVLSLDKEEAAGDPHNLVFVMEREQGTAREHTLRNIQARVRRWTDEFVTREGSVALLCDTLDLSTAERTAVYQLLRAMRTTMRGNYDWCRGSVRYNVSTAPSSVLTPTNPLGPFRTVLSIATVIPHQRIRT